MKKSIVIFYSNNGSNEYLAKKIEDRINCSIEKLRPRLNLHILLLLGLSLGNMSIKTNLSQYELVILCGPIWMGKLIAPLKTFIIKNRKSIKNLVFVTSCGSSFDMKEQKFGHGLVFREIKELLNEKCLHCEAFPISLVLPKEKKDDSNLVMQTRLNDDNFKGEMLSRFDSFIKLLYSHFDLLNTI